MPKPKRPRDPAQLAKLIGDIATGERPNDSPKAGEPESRRAVMGRKGGLRGGEARARALSPKRRREIAKKAAAARWKQPS